MYPLLASFCFFFLHFSIFRYHSHLWGCMYRHRCSVMLILCIYLVSPCLPLFVCFLSLSFCLCFFLSPSHELQSRGKAFTTNISNKNTSFFFPHALLSQSHEPLESFVGFFSYWAGSCHCLPFSVGEVEAHQTQLAITHIMSAHEGEQVEEAEGELQR